MILENTCVNFEITRVNFDKYPREFFIPRVNYKWLRWLLRGASRATGLEIRRATSGEQVGVLRERSRRANADSVLKHAGGKEDA